jgi:hypothetical protein
VSFQQSNAFNEDERLIFQTAFDDAKGRIEFVPGPTFPANSMEFAMFRKLSEAELMKQYSFGSLKDTIASSEVVSRLLTNLISLSKMKGGEAFVQIFLDTTLTFINPYESHQGSRIPFVSESWLIASSLCLVTLFYLSGLPIELILAARPKLFVFISAYAFTRDAVWWTADQKAADFQFLRQLRHALLDFFAQEFKADSIVALEAFDAIAGFLEQAKPQAADDVLKFLIALFRVDPTRFTQIIPNSNLLAGIVHLWVKFQYWHIEIIREKKERFLAMIRQFRLNFFFNSEFAVRSSLSEVVRSEAAVVFGVDFPAFLGTEFSKCRIEVDRSNIETCGRNSRAVFCCLRSDPSVFQGGVIARQRSTLDWSRLQICQVVTEAFSKESNTFGIS